MEKGVLESGLTLTRSNSSYSDLPPSTSYRANEGEVVAFLNAGYKGLYTKSVLIRYIV